MISEVDRTLDHNVIRPSTSLWSFPVVMMRKLDGTWRFYIDYHKLYSIPHRDSYSLPRIDSTLDSLNGATYFTTLDLTSRYWQVDMAKDDREKTAFSTPQGHFEFIVMPFGLTNALATFQRLMECVLAELSGEECLIYLDHVIVVNVLFKEHLQQVGQGFWCFTEGSVKVETKQAWLCLEECQVFGTHCICKGYSPGPSKVHHTHHHKAQRSLSNSLCHQTTINTLFPIMQT